MQNSSRPVRASRLRSTQTVRDVLPFPEGLPDPSQEDEILLHDLNQGTYTAEQLARVDDFLVRALFERKYSLKAKLKNSETQKFYPSAPLPNALAMEVARGWSKAEELIPSLWRHQVLTIWTEKVLPNLETAVKQPNLKPEDGHCFVK